MKQINKDITLWIADKIIAGVGEEKELVGKDVGYFAKRKYKQKI